MMKRNLAKGLIPKKRAKSHPKEKKKLEKQGRVLEIVSKKIKKNVRASSAGKGLAP